MEYLVFRTMVQNTCIGGFRVFSLVPARFMTLAASGKQAEAWAHRFMIHPADHKLRSVLYEAVPSQASASDDETVTGRVCKPTDIL
jgi:hypothetical protein